MFQVLLPILEKIKVNYWVFGGISIAAYTGKFIRKNQDVDIFVKQGSFEQAKLIFSAFCKQNNFELVSFQKDGKRPKIEIKIDNKEIFSMIPIYQKNNKIIFKYDDSDQEYSDKILKRVEQNILGFKFFTPQNKFIKEMFLKHIEVRQDKKKRLKIIKDAKVILSPEELSDYGF